MTVEVKKIRFSVLLFLTVLMIIAIPFLREFVRIQLLLDIFTTLILIAAVWATGTKKIRTAIALVLALLFIVLTWANYLVHSDVLMLVSSTIGILFFGFVVYSILKHIIETDIVTREIIFAAIVSYLLLAIAWAYGYAILEQVFPGSFNVFEGRPETFRYNSLYFSFVTITTLGYGDIVPLTQKASSMAIVEALVGQIYMVVLVAWLVGMYVSRKSR